MSRVESDLRGMSLVELVQFDAEKWDGRIEDDGREGRLDKLAAQALRDHGNGLSTEF